MNKKIIVAPSGRKYYRHSSGMGSVMCWNDNGTERETLILDMKYHNVTKTWEARGDDISDITNYTTYPFTVQSDNYYILDSSSSTPSDYDGQTDDVLNAKFNWTDENTSKHNTDVLIVQYPDWDYAANFCRSILIDNEGCDLPNMQTLVRIFCDRATIHSLDKSDTNDRWSGWFDNVRVWSSSECNSDLSWRISGSGFVEYLFKDFYGYIVPVLGIV